MAGRTAAPADRASHRPRQPCDAGTGEHSAAVANPTVRGLKGRVFSAPCVRSPFLKNDRRRFTVFSLGLPRLGGIDP
jgi:hypothetical protein